MKVAWWVYFLWWLGWGLKILHLILRLQFKHHLTG